MTQTYLYCSTKIPIWWIAKLKMKKVLRKVKNKNKKDFKYILDKITNKQSYRAGLYHFYQSAYQGKVSEVMILSLNSLGNIKQQNEFMERMQELNIPVFSLKLNRYIQEDMI
ncbi:hypothetical protein MKD14_20015 [[Clostridium] innocuum]|nr:hypothetical protein [[Clostridium] innocuum]